MPETRTVLKSCLFHINVVEACLQPSAWKNDVVKTILSSQGIAYNQETAYALNEAAENVEIDGNLHF
jgi:hypothetical protein